MKSTGAWKSNTRASGKRGNDGEAGLQQEAMKLLNHGFLRVGAAVPVLKLADPAFNADRIAALMEEAAAGGVRVLVFPELCLTGYSCADLFQQEALIRAAEAGLGLLLKRTAGLSLLAMVGLPVAAGTGLYNTAAVIAGGRILGLVPKTHIPGYKEFYEERWFNSGTCAGAGSLLLAGQEVPFGTDLLFAGAGESLFMLGVEICEDLWVPAPPSSFQAMSGALLLCNLSASNEIIGKADYRRELVRSQSGRCQAAYVYSSAGVHESTTDLVFGGHCLIAEGGVVLEESPRFARGSNLIFQDVDLERMANERRRLTTFAEAGQWNGARAFRAISFNLPPSPADRPPAGLARRVDPHPFVPADRSTRDQRCAEIFSIQTSGLARRLEHSGVQVAVLGISGGLDSTLALLAAVRTFDLLDRPRGDILAVTMPGFGTSDLTYNNALQLMRSLGVSVREIPISEACLRHFTDIGHDPNRHDLVYENTQSRERTQILMDLANQAGGLVVGTGDLSELALGWCTYNGDHMSMYGVNAGVPKTLVRYLVEWVADNVVDADTREVLMKILQTPITPELLPLDAHGSIQQKTEDILGPYELHDFYLYHFARYGAPPAKLLMLARAAFAERYEPARLKTVLALFLRRFFSQQYKRSCLPDGPKLGSISLSPRGDWRMPSDASAELWLRELEES
jgi:NAD+ synthase (glutamine-hydrolysing)